MMAPGNRKAEGPRLSSEKYHTSLTVTQQGGGAPGSEPSLLPATLSWRRPEAGSPKPCPDLVFLQLRVPGGVWCRGGSRRKQLVPVTHASKCHVIPGAFSLCLHLHPPPTCHLENRLQGGGGGEAWVSREASLLLCPLESPWGGVAARGVSG